MKFDQTEINVDKYIQGELTGDALIEFEALLEKDKTLQEKVNFSQYADTVLYKNLASENMEDSGVADIKPILDKLGSKYFSENEDENTEAERTIAVSESDKTELKPNRIRRLLPFIALAAAATFLLFWFVPNTENDLYAKHFELPKNQDKMDHIDNPSVFDKANRAYKSEDYKQALVGFEAYLLNEPNNPKALLYKGGAELALQQTDAAIITFQHLAQNQRYADEANWYLALCYLKKDETAKAKNYLLSISLEDKFYYNKAQLLLKEL